MPVDKDLVRTMSVGDHEVETSLATKDDVAPEVLRQAYLRYVQDGASIDDIAIELQVARRTVLAWSRKHNWLTRRTELIQEAMDTADLEYREFLANNRRPTAERHLRIAKKMEELIEAQLTVIEQMDDGKDKSAAIRRLSESLSSATTVSSRAAGITDRPAPVGGPGGKNGNAKQPLVMLNIAATKDNNSCVAQRKDGSGIIDVSV